MTITSVSDRKISDQIRFVYEAMGVLEYTQKDLARLSHFSEATISRLLDFETIEHDVSFNECFRNKDFNRLFNIGIVIDRLLSECEYRLSRLEKLRHFYNYHFPKPNESKEAALNKLQLNSFDEFTSKIIEDVRSKYSEEEWKLFNIYLGNIDIKKPQ